MPTIVTCGKTWPAKGSACRALEVKRNASSMRVSTTANRPKCSRTMVVTTAARM